MTICIKIFNLIRSKNVDTLQNNVEKINDRKSPLNVDNKYFPENKPKAKYQTLFSNFSSNKLNANNTNNSTNLSLFCMFFINLAFPKYKIDLSALNLNDLPMNEVLKILKTKNNFLFEETKEEKDLTEKIHKMTTESIEDIKE